MNDSQQKHVFISYLRENEDQINRLVDDLTSHGVRVWIDRNDIKPGTRWKDTIRKAIRDGNYFIACFSKEYALRSKAYMNEELLLAIEELRQYPTNRVWFLPVLISECDIPEFRIGPGETLSDIQQISLFNNWEIGIQKIIHVIDPIPVIIQKLIHSLNTGDKNVRLHAISALGKTGSLYAVPLLIDELNDKDLQVKKFALNAVSHLGPIAKSAVPSLIEILREQNTHISYLRNMICAVNAINKIGEHAESAVPTLIELLNFEKLNVDRQLYNEYCNGDDEEAELIINLRIEIITTLGKIGSSLTEVVQSLILELENIVPKIKRYALQTLWEIGLPAKHNITKMIEYLKDIEDSYVIGYSMASMGTYAIPFLIEGLSHTSMKVRINSAAALCEIAQEPKIVIPAIIDAHDSDDIDSFSISLSKFGRIAIPYLIEVVSNKKFSHKTRVQSIWAIENIGQSAQDVVFELSQILKDDDTELRKFIMRAISNICTKDTEEYPLIIEALKDKNQEVRQASAKTLMNIGPKKKESILGLSEALKDDCQHVRFNAVWALKGLTWGAKFAIDGLIYALEDEDKNIKRMAADTLIEFSKNDRLIMLKLKNDLNMKDKSSNHLIEYILVNIEA